MLNKLNQLKCLNIYIQIFSLVHTWDQLQTQSISEWPGCADSHTLPFDSMAFICRQSQQHLAWLFKDSFCTKRKRAERDRAPALAPGWEWQSQVTKFHYYSLTVEYPSALGASKRKQKEGNITFPKTTGTYFSKCLKTILEE